MCHIVFKITPFSQKQKVNESVCWQIPWRRVWWTVWRVGQVGIYWSAAAPRAPTFGSDSVTLQINILYHFVTTVSDNTVSAVQNATMHFCDFFMNTWSNWRPNDSFGICMSWGFRITPYMLNLMKFWLSYLRLKIIDTISKIDCSSIFYWLLGNWALSWTLNISVNAA